jgi:DnaK suppressor protein
MAQKLNQAKKSAGSSKKSTGAAKPPAPSGKRVVPGTTKEKDKAAAGGKTATNAAPVPAARAGKLAPSKAAPAKAVPGKPGAGKAPAAAGAANDVKAKLPSVADRARLATAAARAAAAKAGAAKPPVERKPHAKIKSPYSRKSLGPLKQKLHDLRTRLAGDIDSMGKEALRADEPEVDAENVADYGSDAFERTITLELMENEARTLRLINEALEAMEAGVFGVCGACGEPIPLARLEALPFASNCVKCQAAAERLL